MEYREAHLSNLNIFDSISMFNSDNSSDITYSLNKKLFYSSKDAIEYRNDTQKCAWEVYKNSYKMLYLSYETLNNKFDLSPRESFININTSENYYFDVEIESTEYLEVTPIILHYSKGEKTRRTKILSRNQLLKFHENEDKCRLTFKLNGSGHFSIEHIKLLILR